MRNEEELLSIYPAIFALMNAGITIKQITEDVNQCFNINVNYRQLLYLVERIKNNTIHKEYDNIVVIDNLKDAEDKKLNDYCIYFKGLLVTYKFAANLTNPNYIITHKNIATISWKESLLYAKRILKLYHISDAELLKQHQILYPNSYKIDLTYEVDCINKNFNNEFAAMLIELRSKYLNFLAKKIIHVTNT